MTNSCGPLFRLTEGNFNGGNLNLCGICGVVYKDSERIVDPDLIERMTHALAHRGPDGFGIHQEPGLAIGHRRLSIIDLVTGSQPLANEDETVWVTFNGEIYNFQDLRLELEAKGHLFRTRSDTEVLVHLWEELGPAMLGRLRGMFAFGLWDRRSRTLFLARPAREEAARLPSEHRGIVLRE